MTPAFKDKSKEDFIPLQIDIISWKGTRGLLSFDLVGVIDAQIYHWYKSRITSYFLLICTSTIKSHTVPNRQPKLIEEIRFHCQKWYSDGQEEID